MVGPDECAAIGGLEAIRRLLTQIQSLDYETGFGGDDDATATPTVRVRRRTPCAVPAVGGC